MTLFITSLTPLKLLQFGMVECRFMVALGAFFATIYECKKQKAPLHKGLDLLAICATPGLLFGRIANFINAELYGRITNHSFGMVFPIAGPLPRHTSLLYEVKLKVFILFIIIFFFKYYYYKEGLIFSLFVMAMA